MHQEIMEANQVQRVSALVEDLSLPSASAQETARPAIGRHHYVSAFDGLRALAIVPVMLLHVSVATLQPG